MVFMVLEKEIGMAPQFDVRWRVRQRGYVAASVGRFKCGHLSPLNKIVPPPPLPCNPPPWGYRHFDKKAQETLGTKDHLILELLQI